MSLNLKMVTYEGDLTQYIVDAKNYDEAIQKAIEANKSNLMGPYDEEFLEDMEDPANYSIDEVVDMNLLGEIMRRDDYIGKYNGTLIFGD